MPLDRIRRAMTLALVVGSFITGGTLVTQSTVAHAAPIGCISSDTGDGINDAFDQGALVRP